MGFLKTSPFFHTLLEGDMHPADGEIVHLAVNREEFVKLRGRTRIPVVSSNDGQQFKPEQTNEKLFFRMETFVLHGMELLKFEKILVSDVVMGEEII
jgi:hypothetical protein